MISHNIIFQYIQDAASFRLKLEPWLIDQGFIENGGTIYYAVDTDVVKLYSDPQNNKEYARLFKQDEAKTVEILAWALGKFIFYALTKEEPLLVIPPHHLEIERVINGIARNAAREQRQILDLLPELENALKEYKKNRDLDILLNLFKIRPFDLINYALGEKTGYLAELNRISSLLIDRRILRIEHYVERHKDRQGVLPILQDHIKEKDFNILNKLSLSWIERLQKTKSKSASNELIADDAEVLARLEWINNELEGEKKKLILITGDPSLYRAAGNYLLSSGNTFADNYIRQPTVFLASPDFFTFVSSMTTTSDEELKDIRIIKLGLLRWFNVFLAPYEPNQPRYIKRLQEIIKTKNKAKQSELTETYLNSEKIKSNLNELISDWQKFVNLIGFSSGVIGKESITIIEKIGGGEISELRQRIDQRVAETWDRFLQSATEIGYWSTSAFERKKLDRIHDLPVRGVPALRFTLDPVSKYIRELCLTLQHGPIIDREISFSEIREKDPSNYSAFVLFSLAFGAAGRWEVSRTLAKYAYDIANNLPPEKQLPPSLEPITGNEAAYLLSWSIRHSVKHVNELQKSLVYLEEAKIRRNEATGNDGSDIRYEAEYIAVYLTAYFFKIFSSDEDFSFKVPSLADCHIKIIKLLKRLNQDINEEEYVRATVKKQLFVYLFSSALLRRFSDEGLPQKDKEEVLSFLCEFKELIEGTSPPVRTCFTYPVYLATCALFSKDIPNHGCIIEEGILNNISLTDYIEHCSIMPYDKELYQFLFEIIFQN